MIILMQIATMIDRIAQKESRTSSRNANLMFHSLLIFNTSMLVNFDCLCAAAVAAFSVVPCVAIVMIVVYYRSCKNIFLY